MKKTVHQCDFCGGWVTKEDIHKFKRTKFAICKGAWEKERYDMCSFCKTDIAVYLHKCRRERKKKKEVD